MSTTVFAKRKKDDEKVEDDDDDYEASEKYDKFQCVVRGTFGVTYHAQCKNSDLNVALKEIRQRDSFTPEEGIDPVALHEITLLNSFSHPNLVKLLEVEFDMKYGAHPFRFVFELLDKTLAQYMISAGPEGLHTILIKSFMFQLLNGVQMCHSHGFIHRNLRPHVLLINRQGKLKISNFASARAFQIPVRPMRAEVGMIWYNAPEFLLGERNYACPVDMWSVGLIFAEMVKRKPLISSDSKIDTLFKIFQILGTPTEQMWPGVSILPDYPKNGPQWQPGSLKRTVPTLDDQGFDFLQQMICYQPAARITAKAALKHPWFSGIDQSVYMDIDTCSSPSQVIDIDVKHQRNPSYVTNYVTDIMSFRRSVENASRPGTCFLENFQTDITPQMRSILVDWLVEVAEEYHLQMDTLYIAINCVDRFLERKHITRQNLQLLGCACMLLASKIEEIHAPAVDEFVYISDNTYTNEEILRMETTVCKILNCKIKMTTTASFLTRYTQAAQADQSLLADSTGTENDKKKAVFFSRYVSELALQEYTMLKYKPSMIAASSVSLSRRTCNITPVWHETLAYYTEYQHVELHQCEHELWRLQQEASANELKAIYQKYSSSQLKHVSLIPFILVFPPLTITITPVKAAAATESGPTKAAEKVTEDEYFSGTLPELRVLSLEEVGRSTLVIADIPWLTHGLSLTLWKYHLLPYLNLDIYTRFCLRQYCRMFRDALPPPIFTTFPHPKYLTLEKLVDRINAVTKKTPSTAPKLIIIAKGLHRVDGEYITFDNCSLTLAGTDREETVVEGGFNIRGKKEHHVGFETMTIWNSKSNGLYAEGDASTHCTNVSFVGCKSDGVRVANTLCTVTNCSVTSCQGSGIVSCRKAKVHIYGVQTIVTQNGIGLDSSSSGQRWTDPTSSKIYLHTSLRMDSVSHHNNHKNWSGEGFIEEVFVLKP